jgi:hypothetical protein
MLIKKSIQEAKVAIKLLFPTRKEVKMTRKDRLSLNHRWEGSGETIAPIIIHKPGRHPESLNQS